MRHIQVVLMQTPSLTVDGITRNFPYRKVEGLFYYLCTRKRITRDEAIGIFWADCDEQNARKNLRDALYHIKKIVGADVVALEGNSVLILNPGLDIQIDSDSLLTNISGSYKGDFLSHFYIKNCLEFENWAEGHRRYLQESYLSAILQRFDEAVEKRETEAVLQSTNALIEMLHLDESICRRAMSFLAEDGKYSFAISLCKKFTDAVRRDLDAEPEEETTNLMNQILQLRRSRAVSTKEEDPLFLGRKQELNDILAAIQDGTAHPCRFFLVSGEAGVGKSVFLSKVHAALEREAFILFSCCCSPAERELYLKPWNDILADIAQYHASIQQACASRQPTFSEESDYKLFATQYGNYLEKLLRSVSQISAPNGVAIFLDDLQWMDAFSFQMLHHVLFRLRGCPIYVVAACRENVPSELVELQMSLMREGRIKELHLNCFTRSETMEFLSLQAKELLNQKDSLDLIYNSTNGNALFLTELVKIYQNEQGQKELQENLQGKLSPRAVSIIQSRLMPLPPAERTLLEILSIFPDSATLEELQIMSQESEISIYNLLENLLAQQIIVEKEAENNICYHFAHGLIQNYIYAGISRGRRQSYHQAAALFYECHFQSTEDPRLMPALIYHFRKTKNIYKQYTYKLEYMKAFFAVQTEIYPDVAVDFSGSFYLPELEAGENILIPLAEEIRALPDQEDNYQELRMKVEYLLGRYDLSCGDYEKGLRDIGTCIEVARYLKNDHYLLSGYLQVVYYAIQIYDLNLMMIYINKCKELLEAHTPSHASRFAVQRLEALYYIKAGQYVQAEQILNTLVPCLERNCMSEPALATGLAACYNYQGEIFMKREQWEDALSKVHMAIACIKGKTATAGYGVSCTNMGIILYRLGSYDKAGEYFQKARACFQKIAAQWGRTKEEVYSALLELRLDKPYEALKHYQAACSYAGKDRSPNTNALLKEVYVALTNVPGMLPNPPPQLRTEACATTV